MARALRNFAPGYDLGGTPDWCELIYFEHLNGPMTHYEVCWGVKCGRYCMPVTHDTGRNIQKTCCNDGHKHHGYHTVELWGSGGFGGGGCCCTQPEAAGGQGMWLKECRRSYMANNCIVIGMGGCCLNEPAGRVGCWSLVMPGGHNTRTCFCARGGYCAGSNCCAQSFCYDRTFETGPTSRYCHSGGDARTGPGLDGLGLTTGVSSTGYAYGSSGSGAAFRTVYGYNCRHNQAIYENIMSQLCGTQSTLHVGFAPWLSGRKSDFVGGNDVPESVYCWQRKTINKRMGEHQGEHCGAASYCQLSIQPEKVRHAMTSPGWVHRECFYGRMDGGHLCGTKLIAGWGARNGSGGAMSGHNVSGASWINIPIVNSSNTCGGWNRTNYLRCSWGSVGEGSCYESLRTIAHGGVPTNVCGGPCCCGGPAGMGTAIWRYR
jgi:hypothetical protein